MPEQPAIEGPQVIVVPDRALPAVPAERAEEVVEEKEEKASGSRDREPGMPSASSQRPPAVKRAWPVRREHLAKFGKSDGCPGCSSILKGAGFQQAAHDEACRSRIKRCLQEEAQSEEQALKRQREREEAEERQIAEAARRAVPADEAQVPDVEIKEEIEESNKRKGGEEGVIDVDDLFRQIEGEQVPEHSASH